VALAAALTVLGSLAVLTALAVGASPGLLGWVAGIYVAILPLALGAAILRYRLYDLDRIISRALAYGLLTMLLGGGYAVVVLGLGQLLGRDSSPAVAGATLAVAALFRPARRRVQEAVDRRFNRRRHDTAAPSRRSAAGCTSRSTWTPARPSCWPWSTRRCSRPAPRCGSGRRSPPSPPDDKLRRLRANRLGG